MNRYNNDCDKHISDLGLNHTDNRNFNDVCSCLPRQAACGILAHWAVPGRWQ